MTTQHSTVPRRLRRQSDERVLGGVAGGLGDYFNVDPILIRILLVASLVFGGLGLFLSLVAWVLVPDEASDTSVLQRTFGGAGFGRGALGGVLLVTAIVVGVGFAGSVVFGLQGDGGAFLIALVVIGVGAYLLQRDRAAVPATGIQGAGVGETSVTEPIVAPRPVVRRPVRPPSPLGWYAVGAALVGIGLLALAATTGSLVVQPEHYVGVVFVALAGGLLVGTLWGRARFLIVLGILLLPLAWTASLVDVPLDGPWGSSYHAPTSAGAVLDEYRVTGGRLTLDLTELELRTGEPIVIDAGVAFGMLRVYVPDNAAVEVDASVGGGEIRLFNGPTLEGTRIEDRAAFGEGEPDFIIHIDAGLASVAVDASPWRTDNHDAPRH